MDYQFNTKCHHNGTIKAVKSTTGKHAGKWKSRINGSVPDLLGLGVKTIYSPPYIGAAKAAIAKYLHINVSEVEVVPLSSSSSSSVRVQGGGSSTPVCQEVVNGEFDDDNDDEDYASFDLNAAVSSAKKSPSKKQQDTPPPQPYTTSLTANKPTNLNLGDYANKKEVANGGRKLSSSSNSKASKPPPYPSAKCPKHATSKSSNQQKEENEKLDILLRKEVERLQQEKERLNKEVSSAKNEKKELDKEAIFTRAQNDMLKKETKSLRQQADKMKGDASAFREEHKSGKAELKTAKTQKEQYEQEARTTQEEKDRYEKETEAIKAELDTLKKKQSAAKAELDSLKKKESSAKAKATGEDTSQPQKKKQKTDNKRVTKGGTVVKSMKVSDMKEEAVARGVDVKEVSRMNKTELQGLLVVGSTCITKSDAWGEILRLRGEFEKARQHAKELEDERQHQLYLKHQKEEAECQKKLKEKKEKARAEEIKNQVVKHKHHYPKVHSCKLARMNELFMDGCPRSYNDIHCSDCSCRICNITEQVHTCEKCDFDICEGCFKKKTMTPAEKKAEAKRKAALEKEREKERRRLREEMEREEAEHRAKWDPQNNFKTNIIDPADKNMDLDGNKQKGYTVWCSDGYGNDGWHSYDGPPDKEFDSTYSSKVDANERARYLFYWKNPWGHSPEEMDEVGEEGINKSKRRDGLVTYVVSPPDSTTWTVAVVPDAAYAHLGGASLRRHDHDEDYGRYDCEIAY